jgi:hypothetical protein
MVQGRAGKAEGERLRRWEGEKERAEGIARKAGYFLKKIEYLNFRHFRQFSHFRHLKKLLILCLLVNRDTSFNRCLEYGLLMIIILS